MNRTQIALSILAICAFLSPSAAQVLPDPAEIASQIATNDPAQLALAKKEIGDLFANRKGPADLRNVWLPTLMKQKRYSDVLELSLAGALASPDARNMAVLLELRANAFLELNHPQEALSMAKACYNVCEFKESERAMLLISKILPKVFPDDPTIARRFRIEQSEGSAPETPSAPTPGGTKPSIILEAIKIDPSLFAAGVATWKTRQTKFKDRLFYGNVLMASGQTEVAEKYFQDFYDQTVDPFEQETLAEGLARAMRAHDGTLSRANAFLQSRRAADMAKPATPQ